VLRRTGAFHGINGQRFIQVCTVTVIFARMRANAPERGRKRVHIGDEAPGTGECFFSGNTGLVTLGDCAYPTPDITTIGATDLARRGLFNLPGPK